MSTPVGSPLDAPRLQGEYLELSAGVQILGQGREQNTQSPGQPQPLPEASCTFDESNPAGPNQP